jgi:hypothetical protein
VRGTWLALATVGGLTGSSVNAGRCVVPQVVIATGIIGEDGTEEMLSEYLCDAPGCPNYASQAIGLSSERGIGLALCSEHARPIPLREADE